MLVRARLKSYQVRNVAKWEENTVVWTLALLCKWSNFILDCNKYIRTKGLELG